MESSCSDVQIAGKSVSFIGLTFNNYNISFMNVKAYDHELVTTNAWPVDSS